MTTTIADFMSPVPLTIGKQQTLAVAHEMMRRKQVRHLPVLEEGRLVGVVSLGDLHLVETLPDCPPDGVLVCEAMTSNPYSVSPDAPLAEVARVMAERKIGCALVMDNGHVAGIFSTVDALDALASMLDLEV